MKKDKLKKQHDCLTCGAICCRNLSLMIGKPENKAEIEDLKWQLHFDTVKVYIRSNRWHQLIEGKCRYLTPKNRCSIYNDRPEKCRRHNPPNCELYGEFYDTMISTPEELEKYLNRKRRKSKA